MSSCWRRSARALLDRGADTDELRDYCAPEDVDALRRALEPFTVERAPRPRPVSTSPRSTRWSTTCAPIRGRVAVMCGTGAMMATDGILVEWLRWVLLILTGSLDRPGGMRFSRGTLHPTASAATVGAGRRAPGPASRPELPRVANQIPAVALADEIEAGNVRVLVVTGGNPIGAFPEPDRVRAALRSLDALVVVDVMENELTELATHVLPATGQLERADISMYAHISVRSAMQSTDAVVAPVGERRPAWWMLGQIAASAGPRPPRWRRSRRRSPTRLTCGGSLDALAARRRPACSRPAPAASTSPSSTAGCTSRCSRTGTWRLAPAVLVERLAAHREPGPGLRAVAGPGHGVEQLGALRPRRRCAPDSACPPRRTPRPSAAWTTVTRRPSSASTARWT